MTFRNKSTFWAYFLAGVLSMAVLLRYVDFFHLEEKEAWLFEDQIELDISSEEFTSSIFDKIPDFFSGEWEQPVSLRPPFSQLQIRLYLLESQICHRLTLYQAECALSQRQANLRWVYITPRGENDFS